MSECANCAKLQAELEEAVCRARDLNMALSLKNKNKILVEQQSAIRKAAREINGLRILLLARDRQLAEKVTEAVNSP